MNIRPLKLLGALAACALLSLPATYGADAEPGFKSLFNGKDLTGWEGVPGFWSVEDGAITGRTTKDQAAKSNTFLVWKDGSVADFELRFSYKLVPGDSKAFANSGVQYRSKVTNPSYCVVGGYQADMEAGTSYSGILYEEGGRGILAERGQMVNIESGGKKRVVGTMGASPDIQSGIKKEDWNEYIVIARGNHLTHIINGRVTMNVTDDEAAKAAKEGVLALQLHAGPPMTAQFKNIRIKAY